MSEIEDSNVIEMTSEEQRKALIPKWIKVFGWMFITFGLIIPVFSVVSIFADYNITIAFLGLEAQSGYLSQDLLLVNVVAVFFGASAYGLIFGKIWGLNCCLITGYSSLIFGICSMAMIFINGGYSIHLEPIVEIIFLIKLHKIRAHWIGTNNT